MKKLFAFFFVLIACISLYACQQSKNSWEIPEEMKSKIKQDYVEYLSNHSCTVEDVNLIVISQVDSGYAMVIGCKCSSIDLAASWEELFMESAADLHFYIPDGWYISFYKDGDFRGIDEAYNAGWINYEQLKTIWNDYHTQFPKALETWQQIYGGLENPPDRDPSGLDYEINADGVTCTITGMGVCRDKNVVIPEYIDGYQVTAIGKMAFWSQIGITSVTMPNSIISIGLSAFEDCEQMKHISLSSSLESIGVHAFHNCKSLTNIYLPDSLKSISGGAFSECESLTEIVVPECVTTISAGIFRRCNNLMAVGLPSGITDIEEYAFGDCHKLTLIEFGGTIAQWNAINQISPWYEDDPKCYINCLDGQIVANEE